MKKIISLLFLTLIAVLPIKVQALSVDKNELTIETGSSENISISTNVDTEITAIEFTLTYTTYDVPAYFNVESGLTDTNPDGITHKVIFSEAISGNIKLGTVNISVVNNPKETSGTISIRNAKATTVSGEKITLDAQVINVTIGTPEETNPNDVTTTKTETNEKNINLLEKIESNIVKINLKEDVYEYTVKIDEDVKELDLKPIAKNENYKVEITTQKISELKDNQIVITVKDEDKTEEYKITVKQIADEVIEIDDEKFESTYKYKGKWIALIVILSVLLFTGLLINKRK